MKGKKTGGRQKGTPNRATVEKQTHVAAIVEKARAEGITPLEYMLKTLRDKRLSKAERYKAAVDAAPYVHPRLASSTVEVDKTIHVISDDQLLGEIRALQSALGLSQSAEGDGAAEGPTTH